MTRTQDIHPDDAEARIKLRLALRDLRHQVGLTTVAAAEQAGVTTGTYRTFEQHGNNPLIAGAQRHTRGLRHRLILTPHLPADLPTHPTAAVLHDLSDKATDPDVQDARHRSAVLADLAAYRRWVGMTARDMSARWGTRRDATAVAALEAETKEPLLASYQRYARTLGGWLGFDLEPVRSAHPEGATP